MNVFKELALLTDARALAVARVAVEDRLASHSPVTDLTPELREALQDAFEVGTIPFGSVDPATAARHALVLLAERDPKSVRRYLTSGAAESVLALVAAVTVGLVLLQTEVTVEKSKNGKWSIKTDKGSTRLRTIEVSAP